MDVMLVCVAKEIFAFVYQFFKIYLPEKFFFKEVNFI